MIRRCCFLAALLTAWACSDRPVSNTTATAPPASSHPSTARAAREHLARVLAMALADTSVRAAIKRRLDASNAPEGKLQYQALIHSGVGALLTSQAVAGATTPAELLADLDAARGLELYLPVPSQRAAWNGDANYLVGTIGNDGEIPVGFDPTGARHELDPNTPPVTPVIALVPQETDFTNGHPSMIMACVDMCDDPSGGGGGGSVPPTDPPPAAPVPGIYITQSHISGSYESWLKGSPEYEYHVYGAGDTSTSVQLTCSGQHASAGYRFTQTSADWSGQVLLISDADYNSYIAKHPKAPLRIVAWEDDDEACVDHIDNTSVSALINAVDKAYKAMTSAKSTLLARGIAAAQSLFAIVTAGYNVLLTNDDLIGTAVDGSITNDAPSPSNWVLKSNGSVTTGWFTTVRLP